ncbi:chromate transporter, partial [Shigella flexneri]
ISLSPPTICNSAVALVALMFWKLPPWLVVLGSGAAGWLLSVAL